MADGPYTGEVVLCMGLVDYYRAHSRYMEPYLLVPHIMGILSELYEFIIPSQTHTN